MGSKSSERLLSFEVSDALGSVSAILSRPANAGALYVMAHGAGAGMRHPFMEKMAQFLWENDVAAFRYQFPYMEAGRRAPNARPILLRTVRAAVEKASDVAGDLPMVAGGKSMGGRMTSLAAAEGPLAGVKGLVFLGFPLHAAGRPSSERGGHLIEAALPMLFVQGTRDRLAELSLLESLVTTVGPEATMHIIEGGDHSFRVPKGTGKSQDQVLASIANEISNWIDSLDV